MNIPPPILENFYNQGGDDDGDDHEHEDEQCRYTLWRLATNSDGSPLLVCIQRTDDVTGKEAGVSHGRTHGKLLLITHCTWTVRGKGFCISRKKRSPR